MNQHPTPAPFSVPAHKQTDPAKAPGQIVNPIPPSKLYKPSHGGYPHAGEVTC